MTAQNEITDCAVQLGFHDYSINALPKFRHTFSHFHLDIHPYVLQLKQNPLGHVDEQNAGWVNIHALPDIGLSAPAIKLLSQLAEL